MTLPDNDIHKDQALFIRELQHYLRKVSTRHPEIPLIAVDGLYGPETTAAVTAFQRAFRLDPTGRANRKTWDAIFREFRRIEKEEAPAEALRPFPGPHHIIRSGDSGNLVFFLQLMLDTITGRYANLPPVEINGYYDRDTEDAVRELQKRAGLETDGSTDKNTWDHIARLYNVQVHDELNP